MATANMMPGPTCPMGLEHNGTCPQCADPAHCIGRGGNGAGPVNRVLSTATDTIKPLQSHTAYATLPLQGNFP